MGRISKFNNVVFSRICELYSLDYSLTEIAKMLGVSRNTLHRWIKNNNMRPTLDTIDKELMQGTIKRGLRALAEGVTTTEETIKTIEEDDAGRPVERTQRIRKLAPSEKAIQILARRYDKDFSDALQDSSDGTKHQVTHDINVNVMSMRDLSKLNALSNPLGDIALDATQYNSDASDILGDDASGREVPPSSDENE